jgi:Ca2+-binding EF-hand superfamily protein
LFDSIDRNKDGLVSSEEWGNAVGHYKDLPALMKFFGGHTVAEVGCAFAAIDVDDSKDLTWEEFIAAAKSFSKDGTPLAQTVDPRDNPLWKIFTQLDTDGSGNLDKDEITAGLNALGMDTGAVRYWACLVRVVAHSFTCRCVLCVCAGCRLYAGRIVCGYGASLGYGVCHTCSYLRGVCDLAFTGSPTMISLLGKGRRLYTRTKHTCLIMVHRSITPFIHAFTPFFRTATSLTHNIAPLLPIGMLTDVTYRLADTDAMPSMPSTT